MNDSVPLVYIVLLQHECAEDALRCIGCLEKCSYENYKIVIVDNDSKDDSVKVLKEKAGKHTILNAGSNRGYAGGNNVGIRHAIAQGAEYIWIVNPDLRPGTNTLELLVNTMDHNERVGVCGPRRAFHSPSDVVTEGRITVDKKRGYLKTNHHAEITSDDCVETDYVPGFSMLLRTALIKEIGLLREGFFIYWEEVEYCMRAQKKGWKTVLNYRAVDVHPQNEDKHYLARYHYLRQRNKIMLARIEAESIGAAVWGVLDLRQSWELLSKGKIVASIGHFIKRLKWAVEGLLKHIEPIQMPDKQI